MSIETLKFKTDDGLGQRARIGLIVLQSDQTVEHEFAKLVSADGVAIYHARIPNDVNVSPDTLRRMEEELPRTAALLPASFDFDAIGYACTSGATMIGELRVDEMIRHEHKHAKTSNPITACKAALNALDVNRIALVTPYAPEVTIEMQENLKQAGFAINAVASFDESDDFTVARIASTSILEAVLRIGARDDCDAVFISCTSLRAVEIINEAEKQLGKPVIASNQVLAWHLMQLAQLDTKTQGVGTLFNR